MLKEELTQMIALLDESLAELKPKQTVPPPSSQRAAAAASPPAPPSSHTPALQLAPPPPPTEDEQQQLASVTYNVNDMVMARWLSGDKAFYPARITSITGSSAAPVYTVRFKSYDETETVRPKDIRPMSNKRKADGTPAAGSAASPSTPPVPPRSPPPLPSSTPGVVSAAASLYPEAQAATRIGDEPKPAKTNKRLKAESELEAGKTSWQKFSTTSKFAAGKKDSMFRTPEGVNGRGACVGVLCGLSIVGCVHHPC
jgi:survival-of-motor-neuron-related-splicing factor 30